MSWRNAVMIMMKLYIYLSRRDNLCDLTLHTLAHQAFTPFTTQLRQGRIFISTTNRFLIDYVTWWFQGIPWYTQYQWACRYSHFSLLHPVITSTAWIPNYPCSISCHQGIPLLLPQSHRILATSIYRDIIRIDLLLDVWLNYVSLC